MRFSKEWIQTLKSAVPLHQVVGENVNLRKAGRGFMGLCPFHGERSPSFSVGADFYHCFGCKASGDIIKFMMELHGLSFEEACEELADRGNVPLPKVTLDDQAERAQIQKRARIQQAARLNHFVALKYYHAGLMASQPGDRGACYTEAKSYLLSRKITAQTLQDFQVGVSGSAFDGLVKFLQQAKAPPDLARDYGLIRPSQKQAGDYDLFRERILFPLIDARGRVCGFGGRILPDREKAYAERGDGKLPKYMNSPESELFQKSRFLYGLFQAKRAIRETETVVVVEGYFDVVALHQAGIQNVVATCGTALTEDHVKTLTRLAKKIIVFFDQDQAGIDATAKAMEEALKQGVVVYGVPFSSKQDPDEFVNEHGAKALQGILDQAYPLLDRFIETAMHAAGADIEKRSQALKQITQWLEAYSDPVGRALRVDQLQRKYQIPIQALGKLAPTTSKMQPNLVPRPQPRKSRKFNLSDRAILHYFVRFDLFGGQFYEAKKRLPEKDSLSVLFDDTELRAWVQGLVDDPAGLTKLKMVPEQTLGDTISLELRTLILEGLLSEAGMDSPTQLDALIDQAVLKSWAQFSHGIKRQMVAAEQRQDMKTFEELSQQYLDLQRKLKELEASYVTGKIDSNP